MSVKNIEQISIPGFANLAIYSFSYTPGLSTSSGSIEVQFLSESGEYPEVDVSSHSFSSIYAKKDNGEQYSLGLFTIVSSEFEETNQIKTLSVRFLDKSIELDRYTIALRGQMGYDSSAYNQLNTDEKSCVIGITSNSGRVIWLGSSNQACVENVLGATEGTDPCDPCSERFSESLYRQLDCNKYYLYNKRVYKYLINDLISSLSRLGMSFSGAPTDMLQDFEYTGTVRQVLNNICSDIGYTFYYNYSNNSINFINIKDGLSVNTKNLESSENKHKILNKKIRKSRENSKDIWSVAGFRKDSEEKRYSCGLNTCKKLIMSPFQLDDILPNAFHCDNFNELKFYSVLTAKAGKDFRDLFCLVDKYQIRDAASAASKEGQKLTTLNGMTIKKVFSNISTDTKAKGIFGVLSRIYSGKDFQKGSDAAVAGLYFFLAEIDDVFEKKANNLELSLANDFLGKYWMRYYKQHWKSLSYNTSSPDGSVTYYDYKSPINLPFAGIVYDTYGTLTGSPLLNKLGGIVAGDSPSSLKARDTFFFMERPAQIFPGGVTDAQVETISQLTSKYLFKEFSLSFDMSKDFQGFVPDYDPTTHRLFIVTSKNNLNPAKSLGESSNSSESGNVNIQVNTCGKNTSYGLRSATATRVRAKLSGVDLNFYTPPETSYSIILERTGSDDGTYTIPKVESFIYSQIPSESSFSLGTEVNYFDATSNDLQLLAKVGGDDYCKADSSKISQLLSTFNANGSYSIGLSDEREYEIEGFPADLYSPSDGLVGMSITLGSSGIKTRLSFSNSFLFKLSVETFIKKLNYTRISQLLSPTPKGTYNGSTSSNLPTY